MKFESAAVHTGEEVSAQPRDQNCKRAKAAREEHNQESQTVMEAGLQEFPIASAESLEGGLKTLLQSCQRIVTGAISSLLFFSS